MSPRQAGASGLSWQCLERRAALVARLRSHFASTDALEVDTPALRATCASDPNIPAMTAADGGFLQSSPEALLKALVAEHGRAVYQLGHVYRAGEFGRLHQPEFLMAEWYRPGWSMVQLMAEVETVVRLAGDGDGNGAADMDVTEFGVVDYTTVFTAATGVLPHASVDQLATAAASAGLSLQGGADACMDASVLRDLLFSQCVQPDLGRQSPVFVTGYPAADASFARLDPEAPSRALRFELYWRGVELANGGEELTDPQVWCARAAADMAKRRQRGDPPPPLDVDWQAALERGLGPCSGVALGVDRLLMLAIGATTVQSVMPFAGQPGN